MRDLELHVPPDWVAACSAGEQDYALEQVKCILKADVSPSSEIDLGKLSDRMV